MFNSCENVGLVFAEYYAEIKGSFVDKRSLMSYSSFIKHECPVQSKTGANSFFALIFVLS